VAVNGEVAFARRWIPVKEGDLVTVHDPGGGGAGDPFTRDPALVAGDVRMGYVSVAAAKRDYGVALRADLSVDDERTRALRTADRDAARTGTRPA
jgi:N-methylhydantoinase B